ncbi:MAG: hypothetical protein RBQ97_09035 [Acholeplasma sp.]|nr:hypothetical protein [Acholeplasma sp.]
MTENYNIYNLISFSLINNINKSLITRGFNPEYKYFENKKKAETNFTIIIKNISKTENGSTIEYNNASWQIFFNDYASNREVFIKPVKLGYRRLFPFLALKNLYVRSIIMEQLLSVGGALVHSAAFSISGHSAILAGRPGVFKTSILMDAIRVYEASFIGEENSLLYDGKVYPFPLNIDSISYKINKYKDENPSGKFQKVKLGLHLIKSFFNKSNSQITLSDPLKVDSVFYLTKGDQFQLEEVTFENILPSLIENELLEISIPPTHSLSGIKYNYFKESMTAVNKDFIESFTSRLERVFTENLKNTRCVRVVSPETYDLSITSKIIESIYGKQK